ncbi:hypothetical protein [Achromobacter insuavis]|uniref:hypothetical protein n=1 Tax=Achromobacter insuavis TaxID=1287735 RepID=UPI0013C3039F|nr:hypothetical protein [Achromobacter insuavis]
MIIGSDRSRSHSPRVLAAYKIMQEVYDRCVAMGASINRTNLAIRDAYPWGERKNWPYKAWLLARREFYETHGLPLKARRSIRETFEETQP